MQRVACCGTTAMPPCSAALCPTASHASPCRRTSFEASSCRGTARTSSSCRIAAAAFGLARRQMRRCLVVAFAAPRWNPQNTENPLTIPILELSAEEAVAVQLDALRQNDEPWPNHGIQTAYEFGEGIGGLEPCWYFGYRKDLYHMDHFGGQFANEFPQLVNAQSFEVTTVKQLDESRTMVEAAVVPQGGTSADSLSVVFALRKKTLGSRKGSWLTKMLLKGDMEQALTFIQDMVAQ